MIAGKINPSNDATHVACAEAKAESRSQSRIETDATHVACAEAKRPIVPAADSLV